MYILSRTDEYHQAQVFITIRLYQVFPPEKSPVISEISFSILRIQSFILLHTHQAQFPHYSSTISLDPVISDGLSMPNNSSIVGATSMSVPMTGSCASASKSVVSFSFRR